MRFASAGARAGGAGVLECWKSVAQHRVSRRPQRVRLVRMLGGVTIEPAETTEMRRSTGPSHSNRTATTICKCLGHFGKCEPVLHGQGLGLAW